MLKITRLFVGCLASGLFLLMLAKYEYMFDANEHDNSYMYGQVEEINPYLQEKHSPQNGGKTNINLCA